MNRTGLIIALAVAAVVGVVFGLFPQLDLMMSAPFSAIGRQAACVSRRMSIRRCMLARDVGLVGGDGDRRPGGRGVGAQIAAAARAGC